MTRPILMIVLLLLVSCAAFAETDTTTQTFNLAVAEIAEISVASTAFTLTIDNPALGGNIPPSVSDASTDVRYTSIVSGALAQRTVTAQVTTGTVPGGCDLAVEGADVLVANPGVGDVGNGAAGGEILGAGEPGNVAQTVVTGIGSCYTGTATDDGNALTYTLSVDPAEILDLKVAAPAAVIVTLTLTEDV